MNPLTSITGHHHFRFCPGHSDRTWPRHRAASISGHLKSGCTSSPVSPGSACSITSTSSRYRPSAGPGRSRQRRPRSGSHQQVRRAARPAVVPLGRRSPTWVTGAAALERMGIGIVNAFTLQTVHRVIGIGAWLGTIMLFNVWVLIWPNQKKMLGMVEASAEKARRASDRPAGLAHQHHAVHPDADLHDWAGSRPAVLIDIGTGT